jgi:hypothetical protein
MIRSKMMNTDESEDDGIIPDCCVLAFDNLVIPCIRFYDFLDKIYIESITRLKKVQTAVLTGQPGIGTPLRLFSGASSGLSWLLIQMSLRCASH